MLYECKVLIQKMARSKKYALLTLMVPNTTLMTHDGVPRALTKEVRSRKI